MRKLLLALVVVIVAASSAQASAKTTLTNCTVANRHCGQTGWVEDGGRKATHARRAKEVYVYFWAECWPHLDGTDHADGRLMVNGRADYIDIDYIKVWRRMPDGSYEQIASDPGEMHSLPGTYGNPRRNMFTTGDAHLPIRLPIMLHVEVKYRLKWDNTYLWTGPYRYNSNAAEVC